MAILQQNPQVFTTSTDPFPEILSREVLTTGRYHESFQAMEFSVADKAMRGLACGAAQGWYEAITEKPSVISKSRFWPDVQHVFPNNKMIVTIRDLKEIAESFHKLNINTLALHSYNYDDKKLYPSMTEGEKYEYIFHKGSLSENINFRLRSLVEKYINKQHDIMFIKYEDFLSNPRNEINRICEFLDLHPFKYDLNNIQQPVMKENENSYFTERTSHKVNNSIVKTETTHRFSNNFYNQIIDDYKWFYEYFYE